MANFSSYHTCPSISPGSTSVGSTDVVLLAVHVATKKVQMYTDLSNNYEGVYYVCMHAMAISVHM